MTRNLFPLAVLAMLVLAAFAVTLPPDPLEIGSQAPMTDVEMESTEGEAVSLAEVAGENGLLVIFSCTTCPYVKAWEDRYLEAAQKAEEVGIGMIALNPNEALRDGPESLKAMREQAEAIGYTFPYVVDEDHRLADAFGATRTPDVFLFNADLELVYRGAVDDNAERAGAVEAPYLLDAMGAMVEGEEIATETTRSIGCSIKRLG